MQAESKENREHGEQEDVFSPREAIVWMIAVVVLLILTMVWFPFA